MKFMVSLSLLSSRALWMIKSCHSSYKLHFRGPSNRLRHAPLDHRVGPALAGFYILVQVEDILRIVSLLDLDQPRVVRSVGGSHPIVLLLGHKVHVAPGRRIRRRCLKEGACPCYAPLIIGRAVPSAMHINDKSRVPGSVRCCVRRNTVGDPSYQTYEDFTLG